MYRFLKSRVSYRPYLFYIRENPQKSLVAAVAVVHGLNIEVSQYRLLFGFYLLYTVRVPFELLDSAALL
jgi:hypothetical protein